MSLPIFNIMDTSGWFIEDRLLIVQDIANGGYYNIDERFARLTEKIQNRKNKIINAAQLPSSLDGYRIMPGEEVSITLLIETIEADLRKIKKGKFLERQTTSSGEAMDADLLESLAALKDLEKYISEVTEWSDSLKVWLSLFKSHSFVEDYVRKTFQSLVSFQPDQIALASVEFSLKISAEDLSLPEEALDVLKKTADSNLISPFLKAGYKIPNEEEFKIASALLAILKDPQLSKADTKKVADELDATLVKWERLSDYLHDSSRNWLESSRMLFIRLANIGKTLSDSTTLKYVWFRLPSSFVPLPIRPVNLDNVHKKLLSMLESIDTNLENSSPGAIDAELKKLAENRRIRIGENIAAIEEWEKIYTECVSCIKVPFLIHELNEYLDNKTDIQKKNDVYRESETPSAKDIILESTKVDGDKIEHLITYITQQRDKLTEDKTAALLEIDYLWKKAAPLLGVTLPHTATKVLISSAIAPRSVLEPSDSTLYLSNDGREIVDIEGNKLDLKIKLKKLTSNYNDKSHTVIMSPDDIYLAHFDEDFSRALYRDGQWLGQDQLRAEYFSRKSNSVSIHDIEEQEQGYEALMASYEIFQIMVNEGVDSDLPLRLMVSRASKKLVSGMFSRTAVEKAVTLSLFAFTGFGSFGAGQIMNVPGAAAGAMTDHIREIWKRKPTDIKGKKIFLLELTKKLADLEVPKKHPTNQRTLRTMLNELEVRVLELEDTTKSDSAQVTHIDKKLRRFYEWLAIPYHPQPVADPEIMINELTQVLESHLVDDEMSRKLVLALINSVSSKTGKLPEKVASQLVVMLSGNAGTGKSFTARKVAYIFGYRRGGYVELNPVRSIDELINNAPRTSRSPTGTQYISIDGGGVDNLWSCPLESLFGEILLGTLKGKDTFVMDEGEKSVLASEVLPHSGHQITRMTPEQLVRFDAATKEHLWKMDHYELVFRASNRTVIITTNIDPHELIKSSLDQDTFLGRVLNIPVKTTSPDNLKAVALTALEEQAGRLNTVYPTLKPQHSKIISFLKNKKFFLNDSELVKWFSSWEREKNEQNLYTFSSIAVLAALAPDIDLISRTARIMKIAITQVVNEILKDGHSKKNLIELENYLENKWSLERLFSKLDQQYRGAIRQVSSRQPSEQLISSEQQSNQTTMTRAFPKGNEAMPPLSRRSTAQRLPAPKTDIPSSPPLAEGGTLVAANVRSSDQTLDWPIDLRTRGELGSFAIKPIIFSSGAAAMGQYSKFLQDCYRDLRKEIEGDEDVAFFFLLLKDVYIYHLRKAKLANVPMIQNIFKEEVKTYAGLNVDARNKSHHALFTYGLNFINAIRVQRDAFRAYPQYLRAYIDTINAVCKDLPSDGRFEILDKMETNRIGDKIIWRYGRSLYASEKLFTDAVRYVCEMYVDHIVNKTLSDLPKFDVSDVENLKPFMDFDNKYKEIVDFSRIPNNLAFTVSWVYRFYNDGNDLRFIEPHNDITVTPLPPLPPRHDSSRRPPESGPRVHLQSLGSESSDKDTAALMEDFDELDTANQEEVLRSVVATPNRSRQQSRSPGVRMEAMMPKSTTTQASGALQKQQRKDLRANEMTNRWSELMRKQNNDLNQFRAAVLKIFTDFGPDSDNSADSFMISLDLHLDHQKRMEALDVLIKYSIQKRLPDNIVVVADTLPKNELKDILDKVKLIVGGMQTTTTFLLTGCEMNKEMFQSLREFSKTRVGHVHITLFEGDSGFDEFKKMCDEAKDERLNIDIHEGTFVQYHDNKLKGNTVGKDRPAYSVKYGSEVVIIPGRSGEPATQGSTERAQPKAPVVIQTSSSIPPSGSLASASKSDEPTPSQATVGLRENRKKGRK